MTESTVTLSDGGECHVRQLGMFDLDDVRLDLIGPYVYEVQTVNGKTYLVEYDGSRWDDPPKEPARPHDQIKQGDEDWPDMVEYLRYQSWLVHEKKRRGLMQEYFMACVRYILDNCISAEDRKRLVKPEDWAKVHAAALVPELTLEVLAETLQATFQGQL